MAQTSTGFPWHGQFHERGPALSEKTTDHSSRNGSNTDEHSTDVTQQSTAAHHVRSSNEKQKLNGKSRKRAGSLKVSQPVIPQTREEMDEKLSYAPSRHFNVRTIPPWIRDAEEDDIAEDDDGIDSPHAALVAQHNSSPANTTRSGRQPVHATSSGKQRSDKTSRWITFGRASVYPRENFHNEKVDADWLNENLTDYSKPWLAGHEDDLENESGKYHAFRKRRRSWYQRMQSMILRNPFVPLAFRTIVIIFAAIAIGLGTSIYRDTGVIETCNAESPDRRNQFCLSAIGTNYIYFYRDPSGLMAVIVDSVAIAYTLYITYDEYFSKPLGLRPAKAKVRLVLLDLFFIVFQSANLSLSFESLTVEQGACSVGSQPLTSSRFDQICDKAKALSAVLLVSLVAWLFTFSISVLRLVERINAR